ncbi:hypothetical protein [Mucilaginibacter jinjuensis]|uniref:Uncharacterized protein n=1 Tax=Mucilaginibacter jinjuensis TaxID=1176721 RepID=A0ABY7TBS0_9SPHI|nr:hypothetical protein [Mucilaginibacter jinjuensis]WCT13629.1 hypothetical protein PQO05_06735 [Mucilaginibacter jinjuensis]
MRKFYYVFLLVFAANKLFAQDYTTSVTFPAGYQIGDSNEFVLVAPQDAGASGYYEISISYTRGNIAAAATHLASISHSNPSLWREVGRVNGNPYTGSGIYNFTIDCNTQYGYARFRVRAINTYGVGTDPIAVNIKVHSINFNSSWTPLNISENDLSVTKFLPMTNEWNLYVGNDFTSNGANLAIKAIENGNVSIGTNNTDSKLTVGGTVHATEVLVDANVAPADYVFDKEYNLVTLKDVKTYIDQNHHLPEIPSANQQVKDGINLGEMNNKLLKKIEELTLYLIEKDKQVNDLQKQVGQIMQQLPTGTGLVPQKK